MNAGARMDIAAAIKNRQLLRFRYDGYTRTVEPHIYGIDCKGHHALSAYQIGGGSESGQSVGWKLFHVDEISEGEILQKRFARPRPDYNPGDKSFATVIAQL